MSRSLPSNVLQYVRHRCHFIERPVYNPSSFVVYENIESLLLKTIKGDDTSYESEYIKQIYNDETNITQFEIEAGVLHVIFDKKKVDCFDRFLSDIRKLPRNQRLGSVN